jgi:oligopeptide transport system substrate-binding protein
MIQRTLTQKTLLAFGFAGLVLFSGCTKKNENAAALRFRLPSDPPSLDWTLATDNVSKEVIQNLQEGLVEHNSETQVQPALAQSWTISPDGRTYRFELREGLTWSDGSPLVAQDFLDSWERLLNPKTGSEYAYFLFDVVGAQEFNSGKLTNFDQVGVKAENARTLVVQLKKAVAYWIHIPTFWVTFPIKKALIAQHGDRWTDPQNMLVSGPYVLESLERDNKVSLKANPRYWNDKAYSDRPARIEFRVVKDDTTAITLLDSGALDIVRDLPPSQIAFLSKRPDFVKSPYLRGYYIGFNVKDPSVANPKIRQALARSIDRNQLVSVLGALISPMTGWIPPGLLGHRADAGLGFDPEAAKKLWAEVKNPPKSLEFWYDQKEMNKLVAENLQAQWKTHLGVDVRLSSQEWKVYLKSLRSKAPALWRLGWGADYPDPDTFMGLFTCASGNNFTGFCSSNYDQAISQASGSSSGEERQKLYAAAEAELLETSAAILPLFSQSNMHLVAPRVQGFKVNLIGDFAMKDLSLTLKK